MTLLSFPEHATRRTEFDRFEYEVISQQRFRAWTYGQQCLDPATDTPAPFVNWLSFLVSLTNLTKYYEQYIAPS